MTVVHISPEQQITSPDVHITRCSHHHDTIPHLIIPKLSQVEVFLNGTISLRRKLDTGTEEFRVSGDGNEITVLSENSKLQKLTYVTLQPRFDNIHTWGENFLLLHYFAEYFYAIERCTFNWVKYNILPANSSDTSTLLSSFVRSMRDDSAKGLVMESTSQPRYECFPIPY